MSDIPNPYDRVPYESFPYSQSHPEHLSLAAAFYGMRPWAASENANRLRLFEGCDDAPDFVI